MEFTPGMVVYSKSGRDKGRPFIIIEAEENYLYLADGKLRKLHKPKRKKMMHVQKTNFVSEDIKNKLINGGYILDSDIVKALRDIAGFKA